MDEVMSCTDGDPSQAERAWTILELIDKFETSDGYLLKRGSKYLSIKLRNDDETTLLELSTAGEIAKPSKRNTSILGADKIKAYRGQLESICPDRKLTSQDQVQKIFDAALDFERAVRRNTH